MGNLSGSSWASLSPSTLNAARWDKRRQRSLSFHWPSTRQTSAGAGRHLATTGLPRPVPTSHSCQATATTLDLAQLHPQEPCTDLGGPEGEVWGVAPSLDHLPCHQPSTCNCFCPGRPQLLFCLWSLAWETKFTGPRLLEAWVAAKAGIRGMGALGPGWYGPEGEAGSSWRQVLPSSKPAALPSSCRATVRGVI